MYLCLSVVSYPLEYGWNPHFNLIQNPVILPPFFLYQSPKIALHINPYNSPYEEGSQSRICSKHYEISIKACINRLSFV